MSTIKVNKIEKRTGSTLTLGGACTAVTLACGATQSGFGRTGTVDWCTTAKTGPLTVASGNGYFLNTAGGAITVTLPSSPSAGDIVAFKDYSGTWDDACKAVTLNNNGSKINGTCSSTVLSVENQSVTLIYVDGTKGWQDIHDSTAGVTGSTFITATGGTVTTSGSFKIHTFTGDGTFCVSAVGNPAGSGDKVSYVVVAGGGGSSSAGGGAGGYREGKNTPFDSYTASPLAAACSGLTVTATSFPITVGGAGASRSQGGTSTFSTISSAGGGGASGSGGSSPASGTAAGGSGAGGAMGAATPAPNRPALGGAGNTPPVSPPQGNPGGNGNPGDNTGGAGGGGAGAAGTNSGGPTCAGATTGTGGPGGDGVSSQITGSAVTRAGGGGGNQYSGAGGTAAGQGGAGGGGNGSIFTPGPNTDAGGETGTANTGGGAGGVAGHPAGGLAGGSGVVIIRYKYQA